MISTENKKSTLRTAKAQAVLRGTPKLMDVLKSRQGPKGDALEVARTAGILAAKKTWEWIPFCHPIPIEQVTIEYENGKPKRVDTVVVSTQHHPDIEHAHLVEAVI